MIRVSVKPELIRWARERAGITQESLQGKFKRLSDWESGHAQPTLKQLQSFANKVYVPLGYLFLSEPPEEALPIADFRTGAKPTRAKASPNLIDTIYAMQRRQAWLHEHLVENEAKPLDFVASARITDDPAETGREMRRTIGLDDGWAEGVSTWQDAADELRRMIERVGVMAVVNGIVGNNSHRPLSAEEFRGFALADRYAPLIFVNSSDVKSAQMFMLAFELAHIWLGEEGLSGFENLLPGDSEVENWCNLAAAEFLVPSCELRECWSQVKRQQNRFEKLACLFKVSPVVAARRAMDVMLIDRNTFFDFYGYHMSRERQGGPKQFGGDFYSNQNARVGQMFATHVISAALEGRLGFGEAYELTGLAGGTFQKYAARLNFKLPC